MKVYSGPMNYSESPTDVKCANCDREYVIPAKTIWGGKPLCGWCRDKYPIGIGSSPEQ